MSVGVQEFQPVQNGALILKIKLTIVTLILPYKFLTFVQHLYLAFRVLCALQNGGPGKSSSCSWLQQQSEKPAGIPKSEEEG